MARKSKAERKERRKKAFTKAKALVKKALLAPAKAGSFVVLLPFKPMMQKMLEKRGAKPKTKLSELIQQFYDTVIKGSNFENEFIGNREYEQLDEYGVIFQTENLVEEAASGIIKAILDFFKKIKDKKKSGAALTPEEEKIAEAAETIDDAVAETAKEGIQSTVGEKITSPTGLVVVGIVLVGGIYLLATRK